MVARSSLFLSLLSVFALVQASPARRDLVLHERRETVPSGFVENGPASPNTLLSLRMALVSNNLPGLETALFAVSTPDSAQYGQHLTKEEVEAFVAPSPETTSAVQDFFAANKIKATTTSPAGDWLSFSIPVSQANDLFDADFTVFTHKETGTQAIRTLTYSIPSSLKEKIDFIHPTIAFPVLQKLPPKVLAPRPISNLTASVTPTPGAVPASCNTEITPACLQALYGIPPSVSAAGSKIGVSGFIDQFAQTADLKTFLTNFRTDIPSTTTFGTQFIDGGSNPQGVNEAGIEANLDIQYTVGVAGGIPVTFISVGPNNVDGIDGFLDIINTLINEASPPQVLSTSYGFDEPDIPSSIGNSLCNAYMQLGARGTSIVFSSGDGGVSGSQSQTCTTFIPTFPSGCPFVTSIGATAGVTETSASFSSGGFSALFPRPSYQNTAVSNYLTALGTTNSGKFVKTGRGFPDISAQGESFVIVNGGRAELVDGTSCSAPLTSSIIAMLNAELLAAGKPVIGFFNPFIYANPGVFNDITTGSNPGCNTNGFPAKAGWDPVTGLGTPSFTRLKTALGLP
ncbi:family S53 protease-like protein [Hysterangium stoloniferum]|nr:family S53 protease-like protein [Hysterangium stoloniferum]